MRIEFSIPMKAANSQNARHAFWAVRARAVKTERAKVARRMLAAGVARQLRAVVVVTITRVGPRELDKDNLQGSLKAVRDQVAAGLRIDDGSRLIDFQYRQAKGEYAVHVLIERAPEGA